MNCLRSELSGAEMLTALAKGREGFLLRAAFDQEVGEALPGLHFSGQGACRIAIECQCAFFALLANRGFRATPRTEPAVEVFADAREQGAKACMKLWVVAFHGEPPAVHSRGFAVLTLLQGLLCLFEDPSPVVAVGLDPAS
jgi:hypothetical protein